jgi:trigger factor
MVKWEKIDQNKVEMEIEVEEPVVAQALDRAYKKVVKNVSLPGFRKGKVPRSILERKFGAGILYEDALEELVQEAYKGAVEETGIEPIEQPQIDLVQMETGKPFIFKAVVEVKPEVILGAYRGVEVEQQTVEITDKQVEERLSQLQMQHVKLHVVDNGVLEQGDMAVIDFTGFMDGEPFAGGSAENHSLEIGSGSFIPGFEEQLTGLRPGEEKEIEVAFPGDYHARELAGKPAVFKVVLKEIKRREYPELNDDFAKEVSEFNTMTELSEDVANNLKKREENRAKAELEDKVVELVAATSEVYIPGPMVERELDRMMGDMEQYLRMQGLSMEKFLELTGRRPENLRAERRDEAARRVKANLVLDAIIEKEGIEALDEEVDERIARFAESYKQEPEKIRDYFVAHGQLNVIREEIKMRKVIDLLVAEARITKVTEVLAEDNKEE